MLSQGPLKQRNAGKMAVEEQDVTGRMGKLEVIPLKTREATGSGMPGGTRTWKSQEVDSVP